MPAFSFRHIKDLYPMMWRKALIFTESIDAELRDSADPTLEKEGFAGSTEINSWASKVTLDIIGVAGLGTELNTMKNSDNELVHDYEELLEPHPEKLLFFLAYAFGPQKLIAKLPWKLNEIFRQTTSSLRRITRQMVRDKREAIKIGADEHFDILSLLIQSNDFSDEDIPDQLLTFLAAG